jgi:hypothetical protein
MLQQWRSTCGMCAMQNKAEFYSILKFKCSAHFAVIQFKEGTVWHADQPNAMQQS